MAWADIGYRYKKKITINEAKVGGDEINFPILISVTDNDLKVIGSSGHVQNSSGYDICFYDETEVTKLYHEIELYTSTSGLLIYWVCIPSLSSTRDTIIYIYY